MIDYRKCPARFTTDSIERGIFCPATDTHCTADQLRSLYFDAAWYAEGRKTHDAPWLDRPARAVVRWIKKHHPTIAE